MTMDGEGPGGRGGGYSSVAEDVGGGCIRIEKDGIG